MGSHRAPDLESTLPKSHAGHCSCSGLLVLGCWRGWISCTVRTQSPQSPSKLLEVMGRSFLVCVPLTISPLHRPVVDARWGVRQRDSSRIYTVKLSQKLEVMPEKIRRGAHVCSHRARVMKCDFSGQQTARCSQLWLRRGREPHRQFQSESSVISTWESLNKEMRLMVAHLVDLSR